MKPKQKTLLQFSTILVIAISILLFPKGNNKSVIGSNWNSYPSLGQGQIINNTNLIYNLRLPIIMSFPTPPEYSVSRYIFSNGITYLHDTAGCSEGTSANPNAFVFLDFGDPFVDASTNPITYGVTLPATSNNLSISEVEEAVRQYIGGYYSCAPSGAYIHVAVGVTNYGNNTTVNGDHGKKWAEMVLGLQNWVETPPSYTDKVEVLGAIDIEPSWGVPNDVIGWEQGYDNVNGRRSFYNYGTCDSCPYIYRYQDHSDWQLPNSWDLDQIWYASYGPWSARVFPEIYTREDAPDILNVFFPAHEAYQWQYLKNWGATCTDCLPSYDPYNQWRTINFSGALTQYDACHDANNPGASECQTIYADNTPAQGWLSFWNALATDSVTKQNLNYSSDMTWKH